MSDSSYQRDVPSFIEPRPPLILNPFMRPRPQKGTNLMDLFEDSVFEESELVQVYLRLKPCKNHSNLYEVRSDRCLITSLDTTTAGHGRRTQHNVSKMYAFSHIFGPESNQKEIFERVVKHNLRKLPEGKSFTLLTYGASGSGKTFTLMGTVTSPGLVPRSLEYVFKVVDAAQMPEFKPAERGANRLGYAQQDLELQYAKKLSQLSATLRDKYRRMSSQLVSELTASNVDLSNRTKHYVWVSFIEIYNEGIYDLLGQGQRRNASKLIIREDSSGNVYVKGATQVFVRSGEEAYDVMVAGKHNLQVAATGVHAQSSRSHCIFTITMTTETDEGVRTSCVRLCDLAGCERQARARNTGTRMQESRAINSSLHVLERCLRTLRTKSTLTKNTLVPYRESKLTRILGAGLSGTRGEAVSMVVTLNPSPEYANESRHVLQLAAVAKDIHINNTVSEYPSSFESSIQDSTMSFTEELMKLRTENERLHFEIIQSQSYIKELEASMEQNQETNADTMREYVKEAREITKEYYEAQLKAVREEMEEMKEEYESRLALQPRQSYGGSPMKNMRLQINELMTEIAILKENLTAERLARALVEDEVQHLRGCIEERDEKPDENESPKEDVISVTDSDNSDDEDPYRESLEPSFRKEDINRSRLIQQNILDHNSTISDKSENSMLETSVHTLKDEKNDSNNDSSYEDVDDVKEKDVDLNMDQSHNIENSRQEPRKTYFVKISNDDNDFNSDLMKEEQKLLQLTHFDDTKSSGNENSTDSASKLDAKLSRGTYFVKIDPNDNNDVENDSTEEKSLKHTNFINSESKEDSNRANHLQKKEIKLSRETFVKSDSYDNDVVDDSNDTSDNAASLSKIETKLSRETYFVQKCDGGSPPSGLIDLKEKNKNIPHFVDFASNDHITEDLSQKKNLVTTKVNDNSIKSDVSKEKSSLKYNFDMKAEIFHTEDGNDNFRESKDSLLDDSMELNKNPSTFVNKIISSIKESKQTNNSLDLFEHLEQETKSSESNKKTNDIDFFNTNILKENRNYFNKENIPNIKITPATEIKSKDRKSNLENVDLTVNKKHTDYENKEVVYRSPSIIKEDTSNDFEPTLIQKLLGQTINKQANSVQVKNDSIDISEILESPIVVNNKTEKEEFNKIKVTTKTDASIQNETKSSKKRFNQNIGKDITTDSIELVEPIGNTVEKVHGKVKSEESKNIEQSNTELKDNTIEQFENIYKDVTAPRATDFDLLLSQEIKDSSMEETTSQNENEVKYNLRNKLPDKPQTRRAKLADTDDVLLECVSKCESKQRPKRNLRLRRQKVISDDDSCSKDNIKDVETDKLKDIVILQNEFCDVTMDKPAPVKVVKDIQSPEKNTDENRPPVFGIQSCPSKSITRSRRKLFTPRAEPLDESGGPPGDSNERVRVPRPSYHRPRARRKL